MIDKKNIDSLSIRSDFKPLLTLASPLILTGLIQSSMGFFVNIFLAKLGEHELAAGALASWLFFTMIVIIFGTFSAINVLIAHQYGAKKYESIPLVLRDGFILALRSEER